MCQWCDCLRNDAFRGDYHGAETAGKQSILHQEARARADVATDAGDPAEPPQTGLGFKAVWLLGYSLRPPCALATRPAATNPTI